MSNPLTFKYKDPERKEEARFLPDGEYPFTVKEMFSVSSSKAGNLMIPFEVELHGPNGERVKSEDALVFVDKALWKIDQFVESVLPFIKPGESIDFAIPSEVQRFKGKRGRCVVAVEEYVSKKGTPGKKNVIVSYLPGTADTAAPAATAPVEVLDEEDDIPF